MNLGGVSPSPPLMTAGPCMPNPHEPQKVALLKPRLVQSVQCVPFVLPRNHLTRSRAERIFIY